MRDKNSINYTEFIAAAVGAQTEILKQNLWWMFKEFDINGDEFITGSDISKAYARMGNSVSKEEVCRILEEHDLACFDHEDNNQQDLDISMELS